MESAAPILSYDSTFARDAITVQHWSGGVQVVVPPVQNWKSWLRRRWWIVPLALLGLFLCTFATVMALRGRADQAIPFTVDGGISLFIPLLIVAHRWELGHRWLIFEVREEQFSITRARPSSRRQTALWPRTQINSISLNRY